MEYLRKRISQVRSSIKFVKTYDAGCCMEQGVAHWGYRIIFWDTYVLGASKWQRREWCEKCQLMIEEKERKVAELEERVLGGNHGVGS